MQKPSETQRKLPKQSRSKALVDAIFEATVRILPSVGSRNLTTKKIAEIAGVSIGSLYQYFPTKESILGAIMDAAMKSKSAEVQKKLNELDGKTVDECVAIVIDFALELFLAERSKLRELFMLAPELGRIPNLLKLRQAVVERLAEEMKKFYPDREQEEYVRVSFVALNAVMGVIHTMLYDEKQEYSKDELAFELKILIGSYFHHRAAHLKI